MIGRRLHLCLSAVVALAVVGVFIVGCADKKKDKVVIAPRYKELPAKKVPLVFKDSVLERCDLTNTEPFLVSGYSVVVNLAGTGDSVAPNKVREYIYNEMIKHKWGSSLSGVKMPSADMALRDPRVAIVQVDGYLPPGVRKGQPFDVQVSALPESNTSSLAGGILFETDLRIMGADPKDPGGSVNVYGRSAGPIFVNPAYALDPKASEDAAARRSLRYGVVMDGARALTDRPLGLRLRAPSLRLSKYIESRIDSRFQEIKPDTIAEAEDEGVIHFFVPPDYKGDWEHFTGVVTHLYFNDTPEFETEKARQLADEAVKPGAPLMDISYAWEGIGKSALPVIQERNLMTHADPDVAYAAARAAAYLNDPSAPDALVKIARTKGHKFQINAISVLASLPNSPAINDQIRPLLDSDENLVRVEAYKMLALHGDGGVFTRAIKAGFLMDVVTSDAPPVIYATRRGAPRIAVVGNRTALDLPITFSAMNGALTISSDPTNKFVTIFYRPPMPVGGVRTREQAEETKPISVNSRPDLAEIVARLGGEGSEEGGRGFDFNYGQIVSILTKLTEKRQVSAAVAGGVRMPASLMLQELPGAADSIYNAPVIGDQGRPQTDEPGKVGMAK